MPCLHVSGWHTCYQLLGDLVSEGLDIGFSLCTAPIQVFCAGWGSNSDVLQYDRVWDSELCLRFEEPEGDECRVEWKARVWRSELRTRVTSD